MRHILAGYSKMTLRQTFSKGRYSVISNGWDFVGLVPRVNLDLSRKVTRYVNRDMTISMKSEQIAVCLFMRDIIWSISTRVFFITIMAHSYHGFQMVTFLKELLVKDEDGVSFMPSWRKS